MIRKRFVFCTCLILLASCGFAQDKSAILNILYNQRNAWNTGNLKDYMETYWKSDSLIFVGKNGPQYGWEATLKNYEKSYPDKAAMGILNFDIREIRLINYENAFVVGAWRLKREKDEPKGFFTLFLKKINGDWKIIADHSS
ncbi:MAG: DUF4440 domain-containing protein [Flavobacterium sp.]|nr:DUF4440 domain-containing protein [Pedobacter sp.]